MTISSNSRQTQSSYVISLLASGGLCSRRKCGFQRFPSTVTGSLAIIDVVSLFLLHRESFIILIDGRLFNFCLLSWHLYSIIRKRGRGVLDGICL